jgi:hypothetical protein
LVSGQLHLCAFNTTYLSWRPAAPCEAAKLIIESHRSADTQTLGLQEMSIQERLDDLIRSVNDQRNRHNEELMHLMLLLRDRDAEIKHLKIELEGHNCTFSMSRRHFPRLT